MSQSSDLSQKKCEADNLIKLQQNIRHSTDITRVRELSRLMPYKSIFGIVLSWIGITLAFMLVLRYRSFFGYAAAFMLIGCCQHALFISGHDAIHGLLHNDKSVNRALTRWFIHGPMLLGFDDAQENHLEHHRLLGATEDPDRYIYSMENKNSKIKIIMFCAGLATFFRTVAKLTPFGRASKDLKNKSSMAPAKKLFIEYLRSRLPSIILQPLIIGAFWALGLPIWSYIVLWIAPIYFMVFLPNEIRTFCEHAVLILPDASADRSRLITFKPSFLEALYFSPRNMSYHAEHHLWPTIPYYNLPRARSLIEAHKEITQETSYLARLLRFFIQIPIPRSSENR